MILKRALRKGILIAILKTSATKKKSLRKTTPKNEHQYWKAFEDREKRKEHLGVDFYLSRSSSGIEVLIFVFFMQFF